MSIDLKIDELLKAKISAALEDYIELEKKIDAIPERLKDSLDIIARAVESLPNQLDSQLQNKIEAIIEVSNHADNEARLAAKTQVETFKLEADVIRTDCLAAFKIALENNVKPVILELSAAASNVKNQTKKNNQSPTPLILTGVICAVLSLIGSFAGTTVWNKIFLDSANSELAYKSKVINASFKGKEAMLKTLPASMAKQANEAYLKAADEELKNNK